MGFRSDSRRVSVALLLAAVIGGGFGAGSARAQSFNVLYDFTAEAGTQTSTAATAASVPSNLTAAAVSRGSGITPNAGVRSINSANWTTGASIDVNDYYTFGVTPSAGNTISLTSLAFTDQRSGTGPNSFQVRSSVDGFASALFTYSLPGTTSSQSFNLGSISSLQNVVSGVAFRIYGFGATGTAGTYRITSLSAGNGLVLGGTLNAITPPVGGSAAPEPGTLAFLLPVLPVIGLIARRRRCK